MKKGILLNLISLLATAIARAEIRNSKPITSLVITVLILIFFSAGNLGAYEVELLWENAYGGMQDDFAEDVLLAADGGIVMVGSTFSFGAGNSDVYVLKTDINGLKLWDKTYGTNKYEYGRTHSLTSDNGLIIGGWKSHEPWINNAKLLLIKADSSGNEVWSNEFTYNTGIYANSVVEALDAGYVAVGSCYKSNYSKAGLLKTDSAGNKTWLKVYDSPLSYGEWATHIERTLDGGFIICGSETDNTVRGFLIKTDQNNILQWRQVHDNGFVRSAFNCVRQTSDGNFIVAGSIYRYELKDGYVIKTDENGDILWSKIYDLEGIEEEFTSIVEIGMDEYVICGYTRYPHKALCLKINSYGNILWKKILDNAVYAKAIIKADNRTFFVGGKTDSFGSGNEDAYLAKIQAPVVSTPLLYAGPNELLFVSSFDYNQPIIQTAEIFNQGIGILNWHIQEDCDWLDVTPTSGLSIGEINEIEISIDKTGLDVGTYTYDVQVIDSNAVNSPYTIKIKLIIHGYTVTVPDEFDTIQQAIDAASDGGTVIVGPGIHEGEGNYDIDFKGKSITVRGADPNDPNIAALTIIDGSSINDKQYHNGFVFQSNEDANSIFLGLSITGFTSYRSSGILIDNACPSIQKCKIFGNYAGITTEIDRYKYPQPNEGRTVISGCEISDNTGPGIYMGSRMTILNCHIERNKGGGIMAEGGCGGGARDPVIQNCYIAHNDYIGLDLRQCYGLALVKNCGIIANKGDNGGGICSSCNLTVENSIIAGNYSKYNGGAIVFYEPLTVRNCTIVGNFAERGNVLSCNSYDGANIENSIIYGNYPDSTIRFRGNRINYINYCSLEGGINSIRLDSGAILNWGPGNIDADPCFVEPGYWDVNDVWVEGDYHLLRTSPCVDAGTDANNYSDIEGNARPFDFPGVDNNGELPEFDMGAYELVPVEAKMQLTPQTLNCSGKGKWVKAHITIGEGFYPEDVDVNEPAVAYPMEAESEYITVLGGDKGPVRLEVVFGSEAFCGSITDDYLDVTIIGSLITGEYFSGTDTIRVISQRPPRRGK